MRIAMISTPFLSVPPSTYGGTERVVHELVEGLVARGHDVTLFATGDSRTSARLAFTYRTPQWPPSQLPDVNHVCWAMGEVARGGFDIVHAHSAIALALARFVPQLPLVYTLHHERDESLSAFYRDNHDAHFVAISHDQAGREIALPSLTVIHHGLDPAAFQCTCRPADYVCFIGRLSSFKGPHTAIDVACEAGVPIRVAGEIHDEDGPFGRAEVLPRLSQPHVRHLGNIGMIEKVPLLRDARALLAPIAWHEPFGLVLIEAMLSGCPVIAFGLGSVPELVEDDITGYVVRSACEMADLIRPGSILDDFDRARCRARAVERFGRARMVADHERLYTRVAARAPAWRESTAASRSGAGVTARAAWSRGATELPRGSR